MANTRYGGIERRIMCFAEKALSVKPVDGMINLLGTDLPRMGLRDIRGPARLCVLRC